MNLVRRDLKYESPDQYSSKFIAREKGIDVSLAVALVEGAMLNEFDVGIVFSSDTDLLPALELAYNRTSAHIEIACWSSAKPIWFPELLRLNPAQHAPYCHFLSEGDFKNCRDKSAV